MDTSAYFDAASTAPPHPVARQAMLAALEDGWADPGKLYRQSRVARQLLDAARGSVAESLGVRADEVTFAPSGTVAARWAVRGALAARGVDHSAPVARGVGHSAPVAAGANTRVVHSTIEHSAVLEAIGRAAGTDTIAVPVNRLGQLDLERWQEAVSTPLGGRPVTLAALISASHEVGTVQPVAAAARICQAHGVPLYVDAAQSIGWSYPPDGFSVLSASAHKWGGPTGVGVLVVRKGVRFEPVDEGPLNLPAVVAAAASLRAVRQDSETLAARLRPLVDLIRTQVPDTVPDVEVVGDPIDRLPHLVTFSCLYVNGEALLQSLDQRGFAVSSGSSCTSSTLRPSHVLAAMGVLTHGNVRISLHRDSTAAQVRRFLDELPGIVAELRAQTGTAGL